MLGPRKKRTGDIVLETSSPEKKLRAGRRKKDLEKVSEISLPEKENASLHAKEPLKKDASHELSRATKAPLTKPGELFKVKPLETVKLSKQNLKGVKPGELFRGKEGGVLESSMLTKLAERRRRSEAMSASDWEETLKRAKDQGRADRLSPPKEHSSLEVKLAARKIKVEVMVRREEDRLASELLVVEDNAAENGFASEDLSVISCVISPTKRLQVPMTTRSRKGSKQPKLGSAEVEASGMYHSAMEEQEERSNSNRMAEGTKCMTFGKTNEEEKSTRPKRQCAKKYDSLIGVDSSPSAGIHISKGRKSKVIAAPKALPQYVSSDEPGPPLATSTTSKQDKVLLTTMGMSYTAPHPHASSTSTT